MKPVGEFFQRLLGVHLLFWMLSFSYFDALPLFAAILTIVGMNDVLENHSINGVGQATVLQFVVYVLAFIFCYVWRGFRLDMMRIANNMICLSLAISSLAC